MNEIVKGWIISNIQEQLNELAGAIDNEKLWMLGSTSFEEIAGHADIIKILCEAMDYYNTQLREIIEK